MKYVKIRGFSGPYFPVYRQKRIRIFPNIVDSFLKQGNTDVILSIYGKIGIRESPDFGVFHAMTLIWLELEKKKKKKSSFADEEDN